MAAKGRPSKYSEKLADTICNRIASGESVRSICAAKGMPNRDTILNWLARHEDFSAKCARARELQADVMDDRILEVANDVLAKKADPHAAKVAISAFQWRASKLLPKKYGDRLGIAGVDDAPLKVEILDKLAAGRARVAKLR